MVNNKNKNNLSNSLVFGIWPQTKRNTTSQVTAIFDRNIFLPKLPYSLLCHRFYKQSLFPKRMLPTFSNEVLSPRRIRPVLWGRQPWATLSGPNPMNSLQICEHNPLKSPANQSLSLIACQLKNFVFLTEDKYEWITTEDLFSHVCKYKLVNRSQDCPRVLPSGLVRVDGELDRMRFRDLGGVADAALLKKILSVILLQGP